MVNEFSLWFNFESFEADETHENWNSESVELNTESYQIDSVYQVESTYL